MSPVAITVWLLFFVVLVSAISKRWGLSQPLLLVATGFLVSFVPDFRHFHMSSETFFSLFIPPLLFADGWVIPKRELFRNRYSILLLGFGLVFATVAAVGFAVHWLIPSVPLSAAIVLGAVVSPTDMVALSSILERISLPKRLIYVLSGESLINDASGLVAFKFAIGAIALGTFSWGDAGRNLVWISLGGVLVGVVVAYNIQWFRSLLTRRRMEDPTIQTALSLITPYFAYMAAERFSVSGILSVVAAGIYAGFHDTRNFSGTLRIHATNVWYMLTFVLEGLVFLMLGLQLMDVFSGISSIPPMRLVEYGALLSFVIILVRMVWVIPFSQVAWRLNRIHAKNLSRPSWGSVFMAGWLGVRGAVTLAAALSIPLNVNGNPFPARVLIIFLSGTAILVSMLTVVATLEPLARRLRLTDDGEEETEEHMARIEANKGALAYLEELGSVENVQTRQEYISRLKGEYALRLQELEERQTGTDTVRKTLEEESELRLSAISEERKILHRLRESRKINDETLRRILRDLDLVESALSHHGKN